MHLMVHNVLTKGRTKCLEKLTGEQRRNDKRGGGGGGGVE